MTPTGWMVHETWTALVLREPAQLDAGQITDKGYVNQAAVRTRRPNYFAPAGASLGNPERRVSAIR